MSAEHASVFDAVSTLVKTAKGVTVDTAAGAIDVDPPGIGLDDLAPVVGALTGDSAFAPPWMIGAARLRSLRLRRRGTTGVDLVAEVGVSGAGWTVIDGLTITDVSVRVTRIHDVTTAVVHGSAEIADQLHVDVEVALPALVVTAHLSSTTAAAAAGFLTANGLAASGQRAPTAGAGPQLVDLSIHGAPSVGQFIVHVEALDLFDAAPFRLRRVVVDLWAGRRNEVSLLAAITVPLRKPHGDLELDLAGHASGEGWSLSGSLDLTGVSLADIAAALADLFEPGSAAPVLPDALGDASLRTLSVALNTTTRDASITCAVDLAAGSPARVTFSHSAAGLELTGALTVGDLHFELMLDARQGATTLVGAFTSTDGVKVSLDAVLAAVTGAPSAVATGLDVVLHDVALAHGSGTPAKVLLAADLNSGVDLSGLGSLPLIGPMLPRTDSMRLGFRAVASSAWTAADLAALPRSVPAFTALPNTLTAGVKVAVDLDLGTGTIPLGPGKAADDTGTVAAQSPPSAGSVTPTTDADPGALDWHEVGKSFGPLHVARVGVLLTRAAVELAVTGSISVAGLTLGLDGLALRYGLNDHRLDVALRGFGLELKRDPLHIAGAFVQHGKGFGGRVVLRTPQFGVNAIGEFTSLDGHPSAFLYGVLDAPLGGPAFFFVEGLAAGFGYNRRIVPPAIDAIRTFPLVQDAVDAASPTTATPSDPTEALDRLGAYVVPSLGDYFLAVGVKFTSFKLLDSFALLMLTVGEHTEIDLIGTSTYQNPPGDLGGLPPLARVELDLVARIVPAEGLLDVRARLDPRSYVYDPHCRLSGGFAFLAWFAGPRSGDFVLSVGGYHPAFVPPPHYPAVPRVAMTYQIGSNILVRGQAYFALTPGMFMAGASLDVAVSIASASATFHMSIDLLIGWEPYHYEASMRISAHASWAFIHVDVSASLDIWGPDFSGLATVDLGLFSFDVAFGSRVPRGPIPISWARFKDAFLPSPDKVLALSVQTGLLATVEVARETWSVVDPHTLRLVTSSLVPEQHTTVLGVAPMDVPGMAASTAITVRAADGTAIPDPFGDEPLVKSFPSALWGGSIARSATDKTIEAVGGHALAPTPRAATRTPHPHDRSFTPASTPSSTPRPGRTLLYEPGTAFPAATDVISPGSHPDLPWQLIRRVRFDLQASL